MISGATQQRMGGDVSKDRIAALEASKKDYSLLMEKARDLNYEDWG